jgi:hypothetical protein
MSIRTCVFNNPEEAYKYICWCHPPFPEKDDDDDED